MMKKQKLILGALLMTFLFSISLSAQRYGDNYDNNRHNDDRYGEGDHNRYDYDDTVIIFKDYDRRGNNNSRNNHYRRDQERRWKANIMNRAIRIAEADGRITRGEARELNRLEQDLGIYRRNHKRYKNRDRRY